MVGTPTLPSARKSLGSRTTGAEGGAGEVGPISDGHQPTVGVCVAAMSFPDYVTKFRSKMVEIRSRYRETARLGCYSDYWIPPARLVRSSSTPTVPFSTADLLYNSEGRGDEYGNNEFYNRDKEKVRSRDFDIAANRRPTSRSDTKRSFSLDKVSVDREKEDSRGLPNCFPPSKPATSLLRSNGVRNSLLRGEQIPPSLRSNGAVSGRDPDELVAMGTIWSPNAQQRNTSTSGSNTNSGSGKSLGVTASSQACSIQPRRMPNVTTTTRQILVQQAGAPPPTASRPPASREVEPKYADPIPGAPGPFQQRIMELASLEGETVRWERTRKIKKKPKPEKDS